jgi:hypothetical protein
MKKHLTSRHNRLYKLLFEVKRMQAKWTALVCASALAFGMSAAAQDNASSNPQDPPVLKTRPKDDANASESQSQAPQNQASQSQAVYRPASVPAGRPNAIPEGTTFIVTLKDTLDTHELQPGQHFQVELREDLVTPNGLVIPKGRSLSGHVATFEHGYTGARIMLAMDEVETRHGWVPLIATVTGVPGDPSIKSTGQEGELTQKGPDKKRVIENAAIGAGVGAATGAAAGGGKGAAAGAVAGAGLGTAATLLFKTDLKLEKGTNLELRLDRELVVPKR